MDLRAPVRRYGVRAALPWPDATVVLRGHHRCRAVGTRVAALQRAARPDVAVRQYAAPWSDAVAPKRDGTRVPRAAPLLEAPKGGPWRQAAKDAPLQPVPRAVPSQAGPVAPPDLSAPARTHQRSSPSMRRRQDTPQDKRRT
jgi:hypothetical protein